MTGPGWVYVLTHPAWDKMGMVKIGRTGRDPRTRAAEITSVSGLLAPCTVAWCSPVSDMAAAEQAVHRMLGSYRVRKRRELFRVDVAKARDVIEAVASSPPPSSPAPVTLPRPPRPRQANGVPRYSILSFHGVHRRSGRWRMPMPLRMAAGLMAIICWFTLVQPHLQ